MTAKEGRGHYDQLPKCWTICSWCSKQIQDGDRSLPASHGICPECVAVYFPEYKDLLKNCLAWPETGS